MERKLALARDERQGDTRSILRALRLALARAADDAVGLAVAVIGATQARYELDELARAVPEGRLYLLLSGLGEGLGAICFDRACVSSLLQQQTMGQVLNGDSPGRAYTETDAAMAAPLVDAFLPRASELAEIPADRNCLAGYSYAARADGRRALLLLLEAEQYRVFDLTVEIAGGKLQGQITLILPDQPEIRDEDGRDREDENPGLEQSFGVVRAELNAVICRFKLPLSALADMQPGSLLPLNEPKLDKIDMLTIEGRSVAVARLGQCRGMRAVRLNEKPPALEKQDTGPGEFSGHSTTREKAPAHAPRPDGQEGTKRPRKGHDKANDYQDLDTEAEERFSAYDISLPALNPEQAAAEICELAGLADFEENGERT
ncbi:FliM/FliN family flagellar motor C-terminal domain-containing protein [Ruegeria aquimaris]|uniref:FliM/FliN family flagellar motor C-terminal domain-containing protein n=1 Tax=Ruegeria aquimaris TaxID=2984333 RepID=UPI0021E819A6|nr:FliM/FliN family flagellar motor C-terminal domain-containing protein [Ruegeria sp. XHP0148]